MGDARQTDGDAVFDDLTSDTWLTERACQFGDGLFETVAVVDGEPCLWDRHLARLNEGCRRLGLPAPDPDHVATACDRLCAGHERAVLKIFWTAGPSERGYRRPSPPAARLAARVSAWPSPTAGPWRLRLCRHRLSENPALAGIKHLNRLDQVIARSEWAEPEIGEGLMLDQGGHVVSGTMSNLFVQTDGRLLTPPIVGAGIAGVVRGLLIDVAAGFGDPVEVRHISLDDLGRADAVYLTNALIGVVRAAGFETRAFPAALEEPASVIESRALCHRGMPWRPGA